MASESARAASDVGVGVVSESARAASDVGVCRPVRETAPSDVIRETARSAVVFTDVVWGDGKISESARAGNRVGCEFGGSRCGCFLFGGGRGFDRVLTVSPSRVCPLFPLIDVAVINQGRAWALTRFPHALS